MDKFNLEVCSPTQKEYWETELKEADTRVRIARQMLARIAIVKENQVFEDYSSDIMSEEEPNG